MLVVLFWLSEYSYISALSLAGVPRVGIEWNKHCNPSFSNFRFLVVIFMVIEQNLAELSV